MNLSDLKRDRGILCAVLGISENVSPVKCTLHDATGKTPSLKIWEENGCCFFKCYGCGKAGTVIDAVKYKHGLSTFPQALKKLEETLGIHLDSDENPVEVVLDMERATRVLKLAQDTLKNDFEVQEVYMIGRRKIENIETLQKYGVGFLKDITIKEYAKMGPLRCWVFPITDERGNLKWVKCHREKPFREDCPKAFAAPFGTVPPAIFKNGKLVQKPKHGTVSLFPAPELIPKTGDVLYLCPGELKALAMLALGFCSSSITQGEGGKIQEFLLKRIKAIFSKICLVFDNDDAGMRWKENVSQQLTAFGFLVTSFTFADLEKNAGAVADKALIVSEPEKPSCTAPVFPKTWKTKQTEIAPQTPEQEVEQLKKWLLDKNYFVFPHDTLEDLRQARAIIEANERGDTEGRTVNPYWKEKLEENRHSWLKAQTNE